MSQPPSHPNPRYQPVPANSGNSLFDRRTARPSRASPSSLPFTSGESRYDSNDTSTGPEARPVNRSQTGQNSPSFFSRLTSRGHDSPRQGGVFRVAKVNENRLHRI
jgi:hypothetical protein